MGSVNFIRLTIIVNFFWYFLHYLYIKIFLNFFWCDLHYFYSKIRICELFIGILLKIYEHFKFLWPLLLEVCNQLLIVLRRSLLIFSNNFLFRFKYVLCTCTRQLLFHHQVFRPYAYCCVSMKKLVLYDCTIRCGYLSL